LGLAIFVSLATGRTNQLLATLSQPPKALTLGFKRGLVGASIALVIAAVIALLSPNVRVVDTAPDADDNQAPKPRGRRIHTRSTYDIGWFAARSLEDLERYAGRVIPLAGDDLNIADIIRTYKPWVAPIPAFAAKRMLPEEFAVLCSDEGDR
jgi:hypothetical protein